jgi:hypothetical protein
LKLYVCASKKIKGWLMWRRARGPFGGRPGRRERPTKDCEQLYQRKDKFKVPCVCDVISLMFVFSPFVFVII